LQVLPAIQAAPPLAAIAPLPPAQALPLAQASIDQQAATSSQITTKLGKIATAYFKRFTTKSKDANTTYGTHDKGGKFYIGDTEVRIQGDDRIVSDRVYEGTPGLWELIVSKTPSNDIHTLSAKERYIDILTSTNAMRRNNNPSEAHPKSSRSPKWTNLLKPIWSKYFSVSKQHTGSSLNKVPTPLILPSDLSALFDRLDLLLASHRAGNTGVRNEIVSTCDELRRQGVINDSKYKLLMNFI
jgi:hypothetical protein